MEEELRRGPVLTSFAVLFALLAISNISKPLSGGRAGFVFFGAKTAGVANAVLGPPSGFSCWSMPWESGDRSDGRCRWPGPTRLTCPLT